MKDAIINKLEPGKIVEVYAKPLTKEMPEGEARLIEPVASNRDNETFENWKVVFLSDNFECERLINLK